MNDGVKEFNYLLENYWITKRENPDKYYEIKNNLSHFSDFVKNKLGSRIIVNPNLIKLEKIPNITTSSMGIKEFNDPIDYIFLFLILVFLEDTYEEEQFILSSLTLTIISLANTSDINPKIDFSIYKHRKSLVNVLRYVVSLGLIVINDGDDFNFVENNESEVLYQSTGLSRYFLRVFPKEIYQMTTSEEFTLNDPYYDESIRNRHASYRNLLYSPFLYVSSEEIAKLEYIKNYRNIIKADFEKYLNKEVLIYKNIALSVVDDENTAKNVFPNKQSITDILLIVNNYLYNDYKDKRDINDLITISRIQFEELITHVRIDNDKYFSKMYRELDNNAFINIVIQNYKFYGVILENDYNISFLPIVGLIAGIYKTEDENEIKQLELEVDFDAL